jgi:hypothetical protein
MSKRIGDVYKYVGLAGANDLMANLANADAYRLSEQYIGEEGNPLKAINSMANNMVGMYAMDKIGESVLNRVVLKKSFFDVLKGSVAKGAVGQKATESMATALANARIWNKTLIGNASYAVADLAGGLLVDKAIYETMDKMYEIAGVRGEVFDYGTRGQLDTFNKETLKMVLAQRVGSKLAGQFVGATQDKLAESFGRTATPSVGSRRWASDLKTYTTKEGLSKEKLSAFETLTLTMNDFLLPNMYKGLDHIYSKEKKSCSKLVLNSVFYIINILFIYDII